MNRDRLPNRRPCETFELEVARIRYVVTFGYREDGRVGEVFIEAPKIGTDAEIFASDAAVSISLALQHQVAPAELRKSIRQNLAGEPLGLIGLILDEMMAAEAAG